MFRKLLYLLAPFLVLLLTACPAPGTPAPPAPVGATLIQATPAYLSFPGTSSATLALSADGSWTAHTDQGWLQISPASGSGNATLTITVNRAGITPGHYAGTVLFRGGAARETVTVYMRFPSLSGSISGPQHQLRPGALGTGMTALPPETYVPGQVLVKLEPGMVALEQGLISKQALTLPQVSIQALGISAAALATAHGLSVISVLSPEFPVFKLDTRGRSVAEVIRLLELDGRVRLAEPNWIVRPLARTPNDTHYALQWHYPAIRLPQAWALTEGSGEVTIAVLDSGVDTTHPDLATRLLPGYDFITNSTSMTDPDGHGTHVTGTIAAASDNNRGVAGVTWRNRVLPVRVLGTGGDAFTLWRGILYASGFCVRNSAGTVVCPPTRARVINMSLGIWDPNNPCGSQPRSEINSEALAWAASHGVTLVAAAGNSNCSFAFYPAADPTVIAVAATDRNNARAPYSNRGPELWIAAPGGNTGAPFGVTGGVLSTVPGGSYEFFQGTSMASPHVAGVVGLMLAANPDLTPLNIRLILSATATDLGTQGWDSLHGFGLVNAEAAVQEARDRLRAHFSDFTVRLLSGNTVVAEARVDAGGNFTLPSVSAGSYTLLAGNDRNRNGQLGDPGEFFGARTLTVAYAGDVKRAWPECAATVGYTWPTSSGQALSLQIVIHVFVAVPPFVFQGDPDLAAVLMQSFGCCWSGRCWFVFWFLGSSF